MREWKNQFNSNVLRQGMEYYAFDKVDDYADDGEVVIGGQSIMHQ